MTYLAALLHFLLTAFTFAIFLRVILSWFPMRSRNPLVVLLFQITEPILAPLRRVIPRIGMVDFSPWVAIILLQAIQRLIVARLG